MDRACIFVNNLKVGLLSSRLLVFWLSIAVISLALIVPSPTRQAHAGPIHQSNTVAGSPSTRTRQTNTPARQVNVAAGRHKNFPANSGTTSNLPDQAIAQGGASSSIRGDGKSDYPVTILVLQARPAVIAPIAKIAALPAMKSPTATTDKTHKKYWQLRLITISAG